MNRGFIADDDIDNDMMEEEEEGFSEDLADDEKKKRVGGGRRGGAASPPSCQVERCGADLTDAKRYHRRHKVCETHAKAPVVAVAGLRQRFCQQCSRFWSFTSLEFVAGSMSSLSLMKRRGAVAGVWLDTTRGVGRRQLNPPRKGRAGEECRTLR